VKEVVSKHGVPRKIVSDRGSVFTSTFWKQLQEALGSKLDFSTAYHPQTGGQTERTNQILEDMLRACALNFGGSWEEHLPLVEFSYNCNDPGFCQISGKNFAFVLLEMIEISQGFKTF
jgi:transposase InsO family protein